MGDKCDTCIPGHYNVNNNCHRKSRIPYFLFEKQLIFVYLLIACHCNAEGSESIQCSELGVCTCKPNITGDKCDQTVPGWYDIEDPKGIYF